MQILYNILDAFVAGDIEMVTQKHRDIIKRNVTHIGDWGAEAMQDYLNKYAKEPQKLVRMIIAANYLRMMQFINPILKDIYEKDQGKILSTSLKAIYINNSKDPSVNKSLLFYGIKKGNAEEKDEYADFRISSIINSQLGQIIEPDDKKREYIKLMLFGISYINKDFLDIPSIWIELQQCKKINKIPNMIAALAQAMEEDQEMLTKIFFNQKINIKRKYLSKSEDVLAQIKEDIKKYDPDKKIYKARTEYDYQTWFKEKDINPVYKAQITINTLRELYTTNKDIKTILEETYNHITQQQ